MAFNTDTAREAGKLSTRGNDKINANIRKALTGVLDMDKLKKELDKLDGYSYVRATSMLLKYCIPALASIDLGVEDLTVKEYMSMSDQERNQYIESLINK